MDWNNPSRKTVSGIFSSEAKVRSLIEDLEDRGYSKDQISMLMSDKTRDRFPQLEKSSKLPEGAATGGLSGGLLGALIGGLTMAGSVLVPGAGLLIAGPIIGALTGGAIGTTAGSLIGALIGAGIPEHEAKHYEDALKQEGNVLLIAHVDKDEVSEVKSLFKTYGAKELDVKREDPDARRETAGYSKEDEPDVRSGRQHSGFSSGELGTEGRSNVQRKSTEYYREDEPSVHRETRRYTEEDPSIHREGSRFKTDR